MKRILAFAFVSAIALTGLAHATRVDERFEAIYTTEWAWRQAQFQGMAGEDQPATDDRALPSVGAAAQKVRERYWADVMKRLDALDVARLSPDNRINAVIYRDQIRDALAGIRFADYQMPFNSDSSFWSELGYMARRPLRDAPAARNYLARLADVPRYFDEQIVNMRAGLKRGFSVPRATLDGRDVSIAQVAELKDPTTSEFYAPIKNLPASIPAAEREQLRADADRVMRESVIPAYAKLLKFFREEYLPKARTTLAAESMPDGRAWYRQQILQYTTLDLSPDAIHKIGLEQVAQIHAQMLETMKETGFTGSFPEFLAFLRSDPQFYAKTPEELLMRAAWIAKRVDAKIGDLIGHLPRSRFTIIPVPDDIAPFYTSGRGGANVYLVNTYDLNSRALYNLPALTLHESVPGHSLQLGLAAESSAQPAFRRAGYISAFGEGWGLYAEKLGEEMGIYTTAYEHFGRLTYAMWRATRLVVDTGIHHLGWSRDQAIAYMSERTALSQHEIATEVDRYISWPGQALSYKLGEIKIVELRARAEKALGAKFDLRNFHDTILALGSVPLPVLEERIDAFIAAGGPAPQWDTDCAKPAGEEVAAVEGQ